MRQHDWAESMDSGPAEINFEYLCSQLKRLRLILKMRILNLRNEWKDDPLKDYRGMVISDGRADKLLDRDVIDYPKLLAQCNDFELDDSLKAIEKEIHTLEQALLQVGNAPTLGTLSGLFNLTDFEKNVVLLCLALEIDPSLGDLYAYIQDNSAYRYATPKLALDLFSEIVRDRFSFNQESPLRKFGIIFLEPGDLPYTPRISRPISLDSRIQSFLMGINRPDDKIASAIKLVEAVPLIDEPSIFIDMLESWSTSEITQAHKLTLNLIGPRGTGKKEYSLELCYRLGLHLLEVDVRRLDATGLNKSEALRLIEREAILLRSAIYIEISENSFDKDMGDWIKEAIRNLSPFLIIGSRDPIDGESGIFSVDMPKLSVAQRRAIWRKAIDALRLPIDECVVDALSHQFALGIGDINRVVEAAKSKSRLRKQGAVTLEDIWQSCLHHTTILGGELVQRISPYYTWNDIVLPQDILRQLREIAAHIEHRSKVYEDWGFGKSSIRGIGVSVLLSGASGTGKTMAAEVLANHLKLDLFRVDLAGVVSKYIGETEKNLRRVFDAIEKSGAILFFDEADALFGKRTDIKDSHDRYANIEVNYLLQRMEEYDGMAILATNRKSALDQAFMRRLQFLIDMPFPDANSRKLIWEKAFPCHAAVDKLDYNLLSRMEIPGGNIKNIAVNAAFLAADEEVSINMKHVIHAAKREYAKIDKLVTEAEFGEYFSNLDQ